MEIVFEALISEDLASHKRQLLQSRILWEQNNSLRTSGLCFWTQAAELPVGHWGRRIRGDAIFREGGAWCRRASLTALPVAPAGGGRGRRFFLAKWMRIAAQLKMICFSNAWHQGTRRFEWKVLSLCYPSAKDELMVVSPIQKWLPWLVISNTVRDVLIYLFTVIS